MAGKVNEYPVVPIKYAFSFSRATGCGKTALRSCLKFTLTIISFVIAKPFPIK